RGRGSKCSRGPIAGRSWREPKIDSNNLMRWSIFSLRKQSPSPGDLTMSIRAASACALCAAMVIVFASPSFAADEAKRDPYTLPRGYGNEGKATDPPKPLPAATPGELESYSTLHSLGFEWDLGAGDTNHNATCKVAYRRGDETNWHEALPLFRVDYFGW